MTYRQLGSPLSNNVVPLRNMGKIDHAQRLYQTTAFYYGHHVVLGIKEFEQILGKVDIVEVIPKRGARVERYSITDFVQIETLNGPRWGAPTTRGVLVK